MGRLALLRGDFARHFVAARRSRCVTSPSPRKTPHFPQLGQGVTGLSRCVTAAAQPPPRHGPEQATTLSFRSLDSALAKAVRDGRFSPTQSTNAANSGRSGPSSGPVSGGTGNPSCFTFDARHRRCRSRSAARYFSGALARRLFLCCPRRFNRHEAAQVICAFADLASGVNHFEQPVQRRTRIFL